MLSEIRTVYFDSDLKIEACRFEGISQAFPNHFHDYYVLGFFEKGQSRICCNNREFSVGAGDMLVLNPADAHSCLRPEKPSMDYRSVNIKPEVMARAVTEITGREGLPRFGPSVLYQSELTSSLAELYDMIAGGEPGFRKEELFLCLIEQLLRECADTAPEMAEPSLEVQAVCAYLEAHYDKAVSLDTLAGIAGQSKYHLIRSFTRQKGISPYSYLETVRIGRAKRLLELGTPPAQAALETGFSDQSHFTNFFKKFIGLTPRQYMKIFSRDNPGPSEETSP